MNGFLLIADAAALHEDNLISLVRGGIGQINASDGPAYVKLSLVVFIDSQIADDSGQHQLAINIKDQDGTELLRSDPTKFEFKGDGFQRIRSVMPIATVANKTGWWEFTLEVDGVTLFKTRLSITIKTVHDVNETK